MICCITRGVIYYDNMLYYQRSALPRQRSGCPNMGILTEKPLLLLLLHIQKYIIKICCITRAPYTMDLREVGTGQWHPNINICCEILYMFFVQVVACSVDSHFTHLAWMNTPRTEGGLGKLDIPLLSDLKQTISKVQSFLWVLLNGVFTTEIVWINQK